MDNITPLRKELSMPDFDAFAAATRVRLPQMHALPANAVAGVQRIGRLVHVLRVRNGWTLQDLATKTGVPWLWLVLLEQGVLLPSELADDALEKLGHVFPTQRHMPNPGALFRTIAQHLQWLRLPEADDKQGGRKQARHLRAEPSTESAEELPYAAFEGPALSEERSQEQLSLTPIGTFEFEGVSYEALGDSKGRVFLTPFPEPGKTHFVLDERFYILARVEGAENLCRVLGLGRGRLVLFLRRGKGQHRIGLE